MVKIAVINQKGGTGKTTSTINIAGCLDSELRKKVLVVDCDASINASRYLLTDDEEIPEDDDNLDSIQTIVDVLNNGAKVEDVIRRVILRKRNIIQTNIYVLPAQKQMEELCSFEGDYVLRDALSPLESEFDYCIFDCPPHMTDFAYEAMACSQYIIVPAFADTDSLGGFDTLIEHVNRFKQTLVNTELDILGIFFTNVNAQNALAKHYMSEYDQSDIVFNSKIRASSAIGQARYFGKPITYYKRSSPVAKDYVALTKEIVKRIRKRR